MLHVVAVAQLIETVLAAGPWPYSPGVVALLLGTAAQESGLQYRRQLGNGPARGYWQCEPATERDIHTNFLAYHPPMRAWIEAWSGITRPNVGALEHSIVYQILLCRVHYYRCDPAPVPMATDIAEAATRWKLYYNTNQGKGTQAEYINSYNRLVAPVWTPGRQGAALVSAASPHVS